MPNCMKIILSLEAELFFQQGLRQNKAEKFEEAIANFDKALRCKSNYPEALSQKGFALGCLGQHTAAIACFDLTLELRADACWV
ncbi:MAG: hypothetical protein ICV85_20400, partial [Tolypothrix sp. T3-bin4]|nr:hypothetical protein [Tolypothrix sp. T3-bin4]